MSVRRGAPYKDRWHPDTGLLEYEGHDEPRQAGIDPKKKDQPLKTAAGTLTENGKFSQAATDYAAFRKESNLWFNLPEASMDDFMQAQKF